MRLPGAWAIALPRELRAALDADGHAVLPGVLDARECAALAAAFAATHDDASVHARPLAVPVLESLCSALRDGLDALGAEWRDQLGDEGDERPSARGPALRATAAGQHRPLLGAPPHERVFPLVACVLLSRPGADFTGGELVLVEQRPRMQSRPVVVHAAAGDVVLLPSRRRPVQGTRGLYGVHTRHAVSRVHTGLRVDALLHLEP